MHVQEFLVSEKQHPDNGSHSTSRLAYTGVACELTSAMTTGQVSAFDDPTTNVIEVNHQTTGSSVQSSRSSGFVFYLQCAVIVIGFVGTILNGLILYALVASKQHKKQVLIFNQNLLDFVGCFFLGITYLARLYDIDLNGRDGYWLCLALLSDGLAWAPFMSSMINLLAITIERYLKVVHAAWAKQKLRKWMIFSAAVFAWFAGIAFAAAVKIPTTDVLGGVCYTHFFWKSQAARMAYGIWYFVSFYVIIILISFFCYGHILIALRCRARVMAAHSVSGPSSTAQNQLKKIKTNVIKTMILVSALFAITMGPVTIYIFLVNIHVHTLQPASFYPVLFIGYLYICTNPFIYATNFDPVKRVLLHMIPCKKTTQPPETIQMV